MGQEVKPSEVSRSAVIRVDAIRARVMRIITGLPQYEIIKGRVPAWVDAVIRTDPLRAEWHAIRLGGFGGSEIGTLCANYLGEYTAFSSAKEIVSGKLLFAVPTPPSAKMRRGIVMEPIHRNEFHAKYGCSVDEKSIEVLSTSPGPLSWMRYSPDDLVIMPSGERVLCDYKAPDEPHNGEIFTSYAALLAMGRLVAEHNGITIGRTVLSEFSWEKWDTVEHEVERDADLDSLIVEAGESYWAHVLNGEVPRFVMRNRTKAFAGVDFSEIADIARRFEAAKLLAAASAEVAESLKKRIGDSMVERGIGAGTTTIGRVTAAIKERLDVEKAAVALGRDTGAAYAHRYDSDLLVSMVRELGGDPEAAIVPARNEGELRRLLEEKGDKELLEACVSISAHVELSHKLTDMHKAVKKNLMADMEDRANELADSINDEINRAIEAIGGDGDSPPAPTTNAMKVAA